MYLIDTNVISELRKKSRADPGVVDFFTRLAEEQARVFISVITIGELRRGVERIRHRGDHDQAALLEGWLESLIEDFSDHLLDLTETEAQVWGKLRVPRHEQAIDKLIAATALTHGLTLATRNVKHFQNPGIEVLNPFSA